MKNLRRLTYAVLCTAFFGFGAISCSSSDDSDDDDYKQYDFSDIAEAYVNNTVIVTYASMESNALVLIDAVKAYQLDPTQENLTIAGEAWVSTRSDWEQSEAYIFGVTSEYDTALDSWPLDKTQLDAILADSTPMEEVQLTSATGGFHTLEYLLFRDGDVRSASDLTNEREIEYLVAVTQKLYDDTAGLHASWAGDRVSTFLNDPTAAVEQIIDGISDIATEVGPSKIGDPYKSKNVLEVESWYSWNSLTDFKNNIRSIENAYLGGFDASARGVNLSAYVKTQDADLDTAVRAAITAAIAAIDAIPEPFRDQLDNADSSVKIEAAIAACNAVDDIFSGEVKALVVY